MSLTTVQYYRRYGAVRLQNLLSPTLVELTELPRNSLVHLTPNKDQKNIDTSKLYLKKYTKKILVDFIDDLNNPEIGIRKKPIIIRNLISPWLLKHQNYRYVKDHYKINSDDFTLLINNYNYVYDAYRFIKTPMALYNEFKSIYSTIWYRANLIANNCSREQFIMLNIPNELPGLSFLSIFSHRVNTSLLKVFDTDEKLMILELWKWLHLETRESSIINTIEHKNYPKINIVLTNAHDESFIVNLGYLNSWIKDQTNQTQFTSVTQINDNQLSKIFLRTLIHLHDVELEETIEETTDAAEEPQTKDETAVVENEEDDEEVDADAAATKNEFISYLNKDTVNNNVDLTEPPVDIDQININDEIDLDTIINTVDDEIKTLNDINTRKLLNKGIKITSTGDEVSVDNYAKAISKEEIDKLFLEPKTNTQVLIEMLNAKAEESSVTASEYKNFLREIESFDTKKDPYGSNKTRQEASKITVTDLEINEAKSTIPDIDTVFDKTMLKSSLLSFDTDYINHVLNKDMLTMTAAVQKAGIIIKNHEIETEHSVLGTYEKHTLELKPLNGSSSIIHFKIPKVNDDSTWIAGGNKYILRKQRVDLPIRKINPSEVALTSYYGKTFVSRGSKKANSSLEWLLKQINLSIFNGEDSYIRKVAPANVFDNNTPTPYIYSALSNNYKSLIAGDYYLMFSYKERELLLDQTLDPSITLFDLEQDHAVLVGLTRDNHPIIVKPNNVFYSYVNKNYTELGNIFDILKLNQKASPVDFSEIRVFSKTIPVGLFIAYFTGFTNLLKMLNVSYEEIDAKPRMLRANEFSLTFKDKSLIFKRNDGVNSLIIGGFVPFLKLMKDYEYSYFDHKDIYFNLLKNKGITNIYLKEMELMNQLFIDPITESILRNMNEPLTLIGLLIRATEMLQTYHHPDSQDLKMMRIRGYERLSGMVYKELVTSIRQFNNRNINGRSKIDISPYKVWQTIMTDNSKKMVEDINPIQNLKELEVVTYVGEGGRNKDAMNKKSRAYHREDMGVISEATVDSSDVGINAYLSANPNFSNLRGLVKNDKEINMTSLLSTSANLSVGAIKDD